MASPAQIVANRANAQNSTGPRTAEGKARSSRNRLTHGLCGPHTVLPGEDPAEYEHLLNALLEEHKPAGPTETLLVAQLAQAQWKLDRIAGIETELFTKQMLQNEPNRDELQATSYEPALADAFERAQKSLAALARHEAAARRAFDKALSNLWKLQGPRRRHDVERAAHAELEDFIDAYVNAPMPGTVRQHDPSGSYGPRATSHGPDSHNSNPTAPNGASATSAAASGPFQGAPLALAPLSRPNSPVEIR